MRRRGRKGVHGREKKVSKTRGRQTGGHKIFKFMDRERQGQEIGPSEMSPRQKADRQTERRHACASEMGERGD